MMNSANELNYPYSPDAAWRLAVSRRFGIAQVDELYFDVILPVLEEQGIVLECRFAGEATSDFDFWMNRMSLILELSDIHILLDIEPSAPVKWEIAQSRLMTTGRFSPVLVTQMGWAPFSFDAIFHPIPVIVKSGKGRDTPVRSYSRNAATLHLGHRQPKEVQERLIRMIAAAKRQKLRSLHKTIVFFEQCEKLIPHPMNELEDMLKVITKMARFIVEDENVDRAIDVAKAASESMARWTGDLEFLNESRKWKLKILNGEIQLPGFRTTWDIMTEYTRATFMGMLNPAIVWSPGSDLACRLIGGLSALGMYRYARNAGKLAQSRSGKG